MPLIQYTIFYYQKCFPGCQIIIWDNESTDGSAEQARSIPNVSVVSFSTNQSVDDLQQLKLKNHGWKKSPKWVIVVDMDEWLDCTQSDLDEEEQRGTTILKTSGQNIVSHRFGKHIFTERFGFPFEPQSKRVCFRADKLNEISYGAGAHACSPRGAISYSSKVQNLQHLHQIAFEYLALKHYRNRMRIKPGSSNDKLKLGQHYTQNVNHLHGNYRNAWNGKLQCPNVNPKVIKQLSDTSQFEDFFNYFDSDVYRRHEDLKTFSEVDCLLHYFQHGHREKRKFCDNMKTWHGISLQMVLDSH